MSVEKRIIENIVKDIKLLNPTISNIEDGKRGKDFKWDAGWGLNSKRLEALLYFYEGIYGDIANGRKVKEKVVDVILREILEDKTNLFGVNIPTQLLEAGYFNNIGGTKNWRVYPLATFSDFTDNWKFWYFEISCTYFYEVWYSDEAHLKYIQGYTHKAIVNSLDDLLRNSYNFDDDSVFSSYQEIIKSLQILYLIECLLISPDREAIDLVKLFSSQDKDGVSFRVYEMELDRLNF